MVFVAPALKAMVGLGFALCLIETSTRNNRSHNRASPRILTFSLFARCKDLQHSPTLVAPRRFAAMAMHVWAVAMNFIYMGPSCSARAVRLHPMHSECGLLSSISHSCWNFNDGHTAR